MWLLMGISNNHSIKLFSRFTLIIKNGHGTAYFKQGGKFLSADLTITKHGYLTELVESFPYI